VEPPEEERTAAVDPESLAPEEIPAEPEVREALEQSTGEERPEKPARRLTPVIVFAAAAVGLGALSILQRAVAMPPVFETSAARRLVLAGLLAFFLLALYHGAAALLVPHLRTRVTRFNVRRVLKLLVAIFVALGVVTVLFDNWYATLVSLGVLSVILGFALQAPINSFFAWIYILAQSPYRVGDRIRIKEATGDVIDVGYLNTTLWEFGGEFLSTDHPSGRLIKFPNSMIFDSMVYNYSWPLFPYIWNEIAVQVAYDSDLRFVAETMRRAVDEERGEAMHERVRVYRELLAKTAVDHLEVSAHPSVLFRVSGNTWVDAMVRYLVSPRRAGRVKTALTQKILERLNAAPDRVLFPKSNLR
jgi:small-conductance mechanosensitive channel